MPPPVVTWIKPAGIVDPAEAFSIKMTDDVQVVLNTVNVSATGPDGVWNLIIAGVIQAPFTGSITANGSNGYDIVIDAIPMPVGAYTGAADCQDNVGQPGSDAGAWTSTASGPPEIRGEYPEGVTTTFDQIRFGLWDAYGIDMTTITVTLTPAVGPVETIYTGAAWGTGWGGSIAESQVLYTGLYTGPRSVDVRIDTMPERASPQIVMFTVYATSIVGADL